ncbi:MAG TPA: LLM class F420-dependent oxidoreductase, partial [Roseiflexaceae bacterium]|nr:LLM class F420-dependent oxidoreductase [Roseiflexaceae bacterium]
DIWNGVFLSPTQFAERTQELDRLLSAAGRKAEDVRRTLMTGIFFGTNEADLARRLAWRNGAAGSVAEQVAALRADGRTIVGTPEACAEQIRAYAAVGVQEIFLQWLDLDDLSGLEQIAGQVFPLLAA